MAQACRAPSPRVREVDILVVGAGPAGLHAALKAAILNHTVLLVDKGRRFSRVSQAPAIANVPGRPGISGERLLDEGRRDLERFADVSGKRLVTLVEDAEVASLAREGSGGFRARVREGGREWDARAKVVVLATGCVDGKPGVSEYLWKGHRTLSPLVHQDLLGYCLLCEGWSLEGKRVAVVGHSHDAVQIAEDVCQQFAGEVHLLTDGRVPARPTAESVRVEERQVERVADEGPLVFHFLEGGRLEVDKALFALGWARVNSDLARSLGARTDEVGHLVTSAEREVLGADGEPIRGLYAIGDVRAGAWKQVPLAWADAEIAIISAYAERLPSVAARPRLGPRPRQDEA